MENEYQLFGSFIKNQREIRGLTQKDVAKAIRLHSQFVSNMERGICMIPANALKDLALVLGINSNELLNIMAIEWVKNFKKRMTEHGRAINSRKGSRSSA